MIEKLSALVRDPKNRDLALVGAGMVGLMTGAKATSTALFVKGAMGLEQAYLREHPELDGEWKARWKAAVDFYDETHQDPTNRVLHTVGIPMILGGALGLLAAPRYSPPWWVANGSWTAGWFLNFVGHGLFEKGAPAFADDPLSFLAGPVWDFVRLKDRVASTVRPTEAPTDVPPPRSAPAAAA